MVDMNMIVNTSDLVGYEAETKLNEKAARKASLSKILKAWESKQASKAKKAGGFGLLAVSLAACNTDSGDGSGSGDAGGGGGSAPTAAAQSFILTKTVDTGLIDKPPNALFCKKYILSLNIDSLLIFPYNPSRSV